MKRKKAGETGMDIGRNKKGKTKQKKNEMDKEIAVLRKYRDTIQNIIASFKYKTGSGVRRYKKAKRNAYKIDNNNNQYGGLMINVPRLLNGMVVEARKGGQIIYQNNEDKSLIELLTKRTGGTLYYTSPEDLKK